MDATIFNAVISSIVTTTESKMSTISLINEYTHATLKSNDKGEVWMEASKDDILKSKMTEDELMTLHKGGWICDDDVLKLYFN